MPRGRAETGSLWTSYLAHRFQGQCAMHAWWMRVRNQHPKLATVDDIAMSASNSFLANPWNTVSTTSNTLM